ncbi:MAG TPA: hypothetical protein VJ842_09565 [Pyrinomonadaceae bacterium]|nr:hypothetical protein [Pyrinomonadaceae bacterium]
MQTTPTLPLWFEIFKALAGPALAAIFVVVGLIWRDRIERRNAAQSWYEQVYVTEGMDIIIAHLSSLRSSILERRLKYVSESETIALAPRIHWRMFVILPSVQFFFVISLIESIVIELKNKKSSQLLSDDEIRDISLFLDNLITFAENTRSILLDIKIHTKKAVYEITDNPALLELAKDAEDEFLNRERLYSLHVKLSRISSSEEQTPVTTLNKSS